MINLLVDNIFFCCVIIIYKVKYRDDICIYSVYTRINDLEIHKS